MAQNKRKHRIYPSIEHESYLDMVRLDDQDNKKKKQVWYCTLIVDIW